MLCQFQMYRKVIQLYIYIYLFFFRFFSHICYYKVLSRFPCAVQQVFVDYLFYMQQCVYVNPNLLIYPSRYLSPLVTISLFPKSVSLFLIKCFLLIGISLHLKARVVCSLQSSILIFGVLNSSLVVHLQQDIRNSKRLGRNYQQAGLYLFVNF